MYVTIRLCMSLIMDLIRQNSLSYLPLNSKICHIWLCLHSSICKYWPISTKLGHNIYAHKVWDEFDSGTNRIRTSKVICPWIWKNCRIWLVYTLASTNIDQLTPNLVKMYMTIRLRMTVIMDPIRRELYELSALELKNLPYLTSFTLYHLQILTNQYETWPQSI